MASAPGEPIAAYVDSASGWRIHVRELRSWYISIIFLAICLALFAFDEKALHIRLDLPKPNRLLLIPDGIAHIESDLARRSNRNMYTTFRFMLPISAISMAIFLGYSATFVYSTSIYPYMNPGLGGGNFPTAQLVTDTAGAEVMGLVVPMESITKTRPLKIIGDSERYYILLVPSDAVKKAHLIEKPLVKGIVPSQQ